MKRIVLIFVIFLSLARSQDVQVDTLTNIEGEIFENLELDTQVDEIVEQLEFVTIDLNKASVDDLVAVPFITRETANKIIEYRDKIGGFKRREQVFDIPGIDESIKSFLYRNGYIQRPKLSFQTRTRILSRNNIRYFANDFAGNSKTYQLARFGISNFSAGFVIEKDYEENKLNDLTHFFIEYKSSSFVRRFVVGSYILKFGQGILMWSPVALGKGSDVISPAVRSSENHLLGYASTDEVKPLFGGAFSSRFKNIELTLFYSKTNLPSSIDASGRVKYIDFSGINTVQRFPLTRRSFGGIVSFGSRNFSLGVLNFYEDFNRDFSASTSRPFQRGNFYSSFMFDLYFRNLNLFGEIASWKFSHLSYVSGLSIDFGNLSFVFLYRQLSPNFTSINGNAFSERYGEAWNEEGFYSGVKFRIWRLKFSGYWDVYKFPRVDYTDVKNGVDYRVEVSFRISKNLDFRVMAREKSVVKGIKTFDNLGRAIWDEGIERRKNARVEVENRFGKVTFKSRVELVRRDLDGVQKGFLVYQGVRYRVFNSLNLYGRIAFFKTDSYWSRIYIYEDDIDGLVSLIPFYGDGLRWYFVLKYKFGKLFSVQMKYGETFLSAGEIVRNIFGLQIEVKI